MISGTIDLNKIPPVLLVAASVIPAIIFVVTNSLHLPFADYRLLMSVVFQVLTSVLIGAYLWKKNRWVGCFFWLCIFVMFYPSYTTISYIAFHAVLYGMLWLSFLCITKPNPSSLMDAMCIIAVINCLEVFCQTLGYDLIFGLDRPVGFIGHPNLASAVIVFCFPAFLREGRYKYLPIVLAGVFFSDTSLGPVALAFGLLFYIHKTLENRRYTIAFMVLGIVACAAYIGFYDYPHVGPRVDLWVIACSLIPENLWLGHGLGSFKSENIISQKMRWVQVHNEYLQVVFEMGIIGCLIIIGYLTGVFKRALGKLSRDQILIYTALIIISINSFANFPFHIAPLAAVALTWMYMEMAWQKHSYPIEELKKSKRRSKN